MSVEGQRRGRAPLLVLLGPGCRRRAAIGRGARHRAVRCEWPRAGGSPVRAPGPWRGQSLGRICEGSACDLFGGRFWVAGGGVVLARYLGLVVRSLVGRRLVLHVRRRRGPDLYESRRAGVRRRSRLRVDGLILAARAGAAWEQAVPASLMVLKLEARGTSEQTGRGGYSGARSGGDGGGATFPALGCSRCGDICRNASPLPQT